MAYSFGAGTGAEHREDSSPAPHIHHNLQHYRTHQHQRDFDIRNQSRPARSQQRPGQIQARASPTFPSINFWWCIMAARYASVLTRSCQIKA
jgi:hypothetical protein